MLKKLNLNLPYQPKPKITLLLMASDQSKLLPSYDKFIEALTKSIAPDFKLDCNGKEFHIHKDIFATFSPVFKNILDSKFKTDEVPKLDHDPIIFGYMLDLIYNRPVELDLDTILQIMTLTDFYAMDDLHTNLENLAIEKSTMKNVYTIYKQLKSEDTQLACIKRFWFSMVSNNVSEILECINEIKDVDMIRFCEVFNECHDSDDNEDNYLGFLIVIVQWYGLYKKILSVDEKVLAENAFGQEEIEPDVVDKIKSSLEGDEFTSICSMYIMSKYFGSNEKCPILKQLLEHFNLEKCKASDITSYVADCNLFDKAELFDILAKKL